MGKCDLWDRRSRSGQGEGWVLPADALQRGGGGGGGGGGGKVVTTRFPYNSSLTINKTFIIICDTLSGDSLRP